MIWEGRKAGNAYKDFVEANPDKDILTTKEAMDIRLLANRVMDHPYAGEMVQPMHRLRNAIRPLSNAAYLTAVSSTALGSWFQMDLKTTQNVSHHTHCSAVFTR